MGYDCCNTIFNPMNLDFSSGSLVISTVHRDMNIESTNGVICDKNGNLLFYSNGIYIANALDDTMQNGSGLNPCYFTTLHTDYGLTIPQANLIIPIPGDSLKYYLFHQSSEDYFNTFSSFYLYYSIIDMALDGGLGAVVQKNTVLLNDTLIEGRLTACKHANGRDWWLISHEFLSGNVYKFLITDQGIQNPIIQNLQTNRDNFFGQAVFSEQGDKYAYYEPVEDLDIFDFDRCSGDFSNRIHIAINDSATVGGVAFSPSGRYLYVPSAKYVYQFDVLASNIDASKQTIAVWDSTYAPQPPLATRFYLAQLAPDGKIYINCSNSTTALHVINQPDNDAIACGMCQHCIQLPALNGFTIPNHPNYFLGALQGSVCDTLRNGIDNVSNPVESFYLFPNPARNTIYVTQNTKNKIKSIRLYNSISQLQDIQFTSIKNGEYLETNISSLTPGIYFIEMMTEKEKIVKRFVKE